MVASVCICISWHVYHGYLRISKYKVHKTLVFDSLLMRVILCHSRLLGCSLDGSVFKVDWQRLCISSVHETYGGAAWCMSLRPRSVGGAHSNVDDDGIVVAVGCEDGGIKLFCMPLRTFEGDRRKEELQFKRAYPSCGSRVLSVGWRENGAALFAGCSDSTLRCLDAVTGQSLFVCGLEGGVDFDSAIWALKVMKNGTVVTGDSTGKITVRST